MAAETERRSRRSRALSVVGAFWVSFEVMRRAGARAAFAFDRDFADHAFQTVP